MGIEWDYTVSTDRRGPIPSRLRRSRARDLQTNTAGDRLSHSGAASARSSDSRDVASANPGAQAALTVLCIEDDSASLGLIEAAIGSCADVDLLVATDGVQGTKMARRHRPDLVVCDLDLAGMGGEEVLARLRADPVTRPLRVVVLSARPSVDVVDRLIARGAQTCLGKPIEAGELAQVLDQ